MWFKIKLVLLIYFGCVCGHNSGLNEVFSWKQVGYQFDRVRYVNSSDFERIPNSFNFIQDLDDSEKFFIQYNNIPIGLETYKDRVFVTVPRRRYGIPSTLNYLALPFRSNSPLLRPYPPTFHRHLVSVYRPRIDACGRLWAVDTGLLEVPGARKQIQPPAILVFDLKTDRLIHRYELKSSDLVDERTPAGLTSITVDVTPSTCAHAYAYINDLATEGMIVFSLKDNDSWRISHDSFKHDVSALNFTVAGHILNWKDGLFSIALSDPDEHGKRKAYYHPLVSTAEFSIDTEVLKNRGGFDGKLLGSRGALTQSGSHAFHGKTNTLIFANVAQDAILCWRVDKELRPENVAIIAQDHEKLVYISDLKIVGDEVWVLANKIPIFVYSTLNPEENNFYVHRGKIQEMIRGTACDGF